MQGPSPLSSSNKKIGETQCADPPPPRRLRGPGLAPLPPGWVGATALPRLAAGAGALLLLLWSPSLRPGAGRTSVSSLSSCDHPPP